MKVKKMFKSALILILFTLVETSVVRRVVREASSKDDLFEGDIIGVNPDTIEDMVKRSNDADDIYDIRASGAPSNDLLALWPNGEVFYTFSSSFKDDQKQVVKEAMDHYHQHTCIKFTERTDQPDYIIIKQGLGCYSAVGRKGGEQIVSLGEGCIHKGVAVHELMHALGFWHEQSRWDRDNYVEIKVDNVIPKEKNNFLKYELDVLADLHTPYDYGSIMHYGPKDFSKNGEPTVVPVPDAKVEIGQRNGLSEIDLKEILLLYQCSGVTEKPNVEIIQRGVRLFNHYDATEVDSAEECTDQCRSDSKCLAITFDIKHTFSNGNCFLYDSGYKAENDSSLNWFTWTKHQLELGIRLHNHYDAMVMDDVLHCKEHCVENDKCLAMTFDTEKTNSSENCFLYESGYRLQSDPTMQWTSWRKP